MMERSHTVASYAKLPVTMDFFVCPGRNVIGWWFVVKVVIAKEIESNYKFKGNKVLILNSYFYGSSPSPPPGLGTIKVARSI